MEDLKKNEKAVLPDEKGEKVTGGVELTPIIYDTCPGCGKEWPKSLLDYNLWGLCPECADKTEYKPVNPRIPDFY